ncbi:hypothetical protein BC937DRAFT_86197, partial [Endogone sp. FLAS-F59071]
IKSLEKTYSSSSPLDLNPPTDSAEHRQYDLRKNDLENVVGLYPFEDSVDACLIARTFGELLKSLVGLAETVYPALKEPSPTTSLYTSYYILYESCYASSHRVALTLLPLSLGSSPHLVFARHVLHSLLRADYVAFFVLYRTAPTQGHRVLMDACIARVREQAIRTLARAYLRVEIGWVRETLGFVEGEEVVVERLHAITFHIAPVSNLSATPGISAGSTGNVPVTVMTSTTPGTTDEEVYNWPLELKVTRMVEEGMVVAAVCTVSV